ncbi:methylmalonyl Co-A mutase-associated GTPase MeaB [Sporomusa sp. KB1]|uniref:methylmalonyl Co-A mutase-associated GTPase MeaB n=1 Tax=Sporomusa sp. KB1 TaxID=943346 RepID=UPI0011AE099E|nr:methylmalonyl Co-A mutase-associated GTPase MeaB [Sporomusa sp. KB1]TWH45514.1 LAO/AO transport system kinase [Sporomusa sp. KB1]
MNNRYIDELVDRIHNKDRRSLAKAISIVEDRLDGMEELLNKAYAYANRKTAGLIIGVTGPGGAGKSTMIDKLISEFRKEGKTVGVIAVDPNSPYTGGAVLGDRVRMGVHNIDQKVFIRSLGNRGCIGGISEGTKNILYLFKNYEFDVIIVESLGVGQDETEITNFVDVTIVVLVPGFGDSIQMAKAGIQEIGDVFVVNKSDRPDAQLFTNQLSGSFAALPIEKRPAIINAVASEGKGINELVAAIYDAAEKQIANKEVKAIRRIKSEIGSEVRQYLERIIRETVESEAIRVSDNESTPFDVAKRIISQIEFKKL